MAVSRGRALLSQSSPDPNEVAKSITALECDADHIRKCIKAGLRDYDSGQAAIDEINEIIQKLRQKL
jgi:DNA-binding NarL/FixJ family response regulator